MPPCPFKHFVCPVNQATDAQSCWVGNEETLGVLGDDMDEDEQVVGLTRDDRDGR